MCIFGYNDLRIRSDCDCRVDGGYSFIFDDIYEGEHNDDYYSINFNPFNP